MFDLSEIRRKTRELLHYSSPPRCGVDTRQAAGVEARFKPDASFNSCSIRGDEAHPKCVNLLGLKITYGLWTIGVDRAMLHYSIG